MGRLVGALVGWIMGFTSLMALRCIGIEKVQGIYVYVFQGSLGLRLPSAPTASASTRSPAIRADDTSAGGYLPLPSGHHGFLEHLPRLGVRSAILVILRLYLERASSSFSLEVQNTCLDARSSPCY
jgi:hypothetical protein